MALTSTGGARTLRAVRPLCCLLLVACARAPAMETPEEAHAAVAAALADPALANVFDTLDLQSRWAVMSIVRSERDTHELVAARYPEPARTREMARTRGAAEAESPALYFAQQYRARLLALRPAFAAAPNLVRSADGRTATARGSDGRTLTFSRADDGRWAWSNFRDELEARKIWAANALATVRDSVARPSR